MKLRPIPFKKELDKRFVSWSKSRRELEIEHGQLVPLAVGYIAKLKLDGAAIGA